MIREAIAKVVKGEDLKEKEAIEVMEEIMSGKCTDAQIGAFITALRIKGETVEEITGCARVMRAKATRINVLPEIDIDREEINIDWETIVDTCGTGGTGTNTFNISTTTAFGSWWRDVASGWPNTETGESLQVVEVPTS